MRILIYNSSSFGGCFEYGKSIFQTYQNHPSVTLAEWWVPSNTHMEAKGIRKLWLTDRPSFSSRWLKQVHFILRTVINPLLLLQRLAAQERSIVLFNDFEQLSALLWVPLFRWMLGKKHEFVVILHDPDRDAYPPNIRFTRWSMKTMMSLMKVAMYHDYLPDKPYYQNLPDCRFLDIPHGFYPMPEPDEDLLEELSKARKPETVVMTIPGNIREEKNYHLAIEALAALPHHLLLIAGSAANARVDVSVYKSLAKNLQVSNRVVWIEKFLSEAELSAVIEFSDVILLNYAVSFTSQSGILNVVAPFQKELIVSDGPSSLALILKRFKVGELVEPGSVESLVQGLQRLEKEEPEIRHNWHDYLEYASWQNHVHKAIGCFTELTTT